MMIEIGRQLVSAVDGHQPELSAECAAKYLELYNTIALRKERKRKSLPDTARLSEREVQAVNLAGNGLTNQLIAVKMGITAGTVKVHLRNARAKGETI